MYDIAVGRVGVVGTCHYIAVPESHTWVAGLQNLVGHLGAADVHLVRHVPPLVLVQQPASWTLVWQLEMGTLVGSSRSP